MPTGQAKANAGLDQHRPAQMVGGMRVKGSHHRRESVKGEESAMNNEEEDTDQGMDMDTNKATQQQQAYNMHAHGASRQPHIPKNPGTNVNNRSSQGVQERSMNH
ncbi:hypothetical protein DFQ28_009192 [Apophysomyces sp. BC1034]|nr:hypothetical protein DFQ30_008856 [Apophysomyces sp. BC1015]KAG0173640.1 hypothetical protein DFQ29_007887 [Apophysomyces sp. BC1021]KAG0185536.1 hypothetical protein DFQ28_009192 [Apophysomyces sp. BC1034]